ncbi:MAG TPA: slipin family protein, partial [Longimicrobiaceae bacterium]|nr:slipin family protein [Longimicrobiaceae bacterium]
MPSTDMVPRQQSLPVSAGSGGRMNFLSALALLAPVGVGLAVSAATSSIAGIVVGAAAGILASMSPKIARQWERAVVLRMGRFVGLKGPGPFFVIPMVDTISSWIDQRTITTTFAAEETLTSDTVPVNVDAVLFWMVHDAEKAALEVQDYAQAVTWAAQTGLRDIIGRTSLADLLRGRERIEQELKALIDERSNPWGVTVHSVEMRDVVIPTSLQDAMSREAQASREKQARIILGEAEREIAVLFKQAAEMYADNPTALQLRAMNILYEGLKQKGALMMVPSNIIDSVSGGGNLLGAAAIAQQHQAAAKQEESDPGAATGELPRLLG